MSVKSLVISAVALAASSFAQSPTVPPSAGGPWKTPWSMPSEGGLTTAYRAPKVAPIRLENSNRLDQLLSGGKLQLSLQDAIALALENNLDLELERYGNRIAETDLMRAEAGSSLRGIPLSVREGPTGLGGPAVSATGTLAGGDTPALNALIGPGVQTDLSILGSLPLSTGPGVPSLDPAIVGNFGWNHQSAPQNSAFLSQLQSLNSNTSVANVGLQQGFITGGLLSVGWDNTRQNINSPLVNYNPATNSSLGLNFTQPLLRGFGPAVNNRYIRIAKNNRRVSEFVFQQQVISTVSAIVRLYWDLVSLKEDVRVRQQAVASAEQFLRDSENQIETGTAAPIDVTRARAELSRRRRDLSVAQTLVRQQEAIMKDYLTRTKVSPELARAEIVCTDPVQIADHDPVEPISDLVARAMHQRPDLAQARLQLENSEISLRGSKSALLPALDLVANARNNALIGRPNTVTLNPGTGLGSGFIGGSGGPVFVGGYGDALSQLFSRNYPDYGVGVQLTIPLRNRAARADVVRDQLSVRQSQIRLHQLEKQVELEITNALIAVEEARASYEATRNERLLQEEALRAEQEKLEVGASTGFYVIQFQRDLAAAQSAEVSAQGSYLKARTALQRAVGSILPDNGVQIDEALSGVVARGAAVPGNTSR